MDTVWLPGFNMGDGLAYEYGVKHGYIQNGHNFEEDIIAAARSISKRYKCSQSHVKNLESIALAVFDKMKKVHGMGNRERLLLQISVILHNCGKFISLEDVSDCAFNIIMATEIIGLSHSEREMIAYTVKFNTRSVCLLYGAGRESGSLQGRISDYCEDDGDPADRKCDGPHTPAEM